MPRRRSTDLSEALRPGLLRREAVQLAVVAVLSVLALALAPRWLQVVAGVVDAFVALVSTIGVVVAWRAARLSGAFAFYAAAVLVFAALALLNLAG